MMKALNSPRKMWALIGAAGTVAIVALGWVLLISGEKSRKSDLESQIANTQIQAATDHQKTLKLREDNKKLPLYQEQLATLRAALPSDDATAQFSIDMTALSRRYGVQITSTQFSASTSTAPAAAPAVPADGGGTGGSTDSGGSTTTPATTPATSAVSQLPISIAASGPLPNLRAFLHALQHNEARALVVTQVAESAPFSSGTSDTTQPTLTLTMKAFVSSS